MNYKEISVLKSKIELELWAPALGMPWTLSTLPTLLLRHWTHLCLDRVTGKQNVLCAFIDR